MTNTNFNKTGGALTHLNVEYDDLEHDVAIQNRVKSEGFIREDNFKTLKLVGKKSWIYIESLINGKFT